MRVRAVYTPTKQQKLRGESQVNDCTLWELLDEVQDRIRLTNGLDFCIERQLNAVIHALICEVNKRMINPLPKNHPGNC